MNVKPFVLVVATAITTASCPASNVGLSTIEQPVNLGAESDPARIPLGAVATESNYHYGRGPVISSPRPSLHGAMEWKSGIEINQNLASIFGIEVDNHDLPQSPATIHLKNFAIPGYCPYTKEQVLAATIHCLLRSNTGRPKSPISLKVVSDSPDDEALVKKYSGDYVNAPDDSDDPPVEPTPVPGTRLEADVRGVTWVVFPEIKSTAKPARSPVMIPFRLGGESGPDDPLWQLLPVWTGTHHTLEQSLEVIGRPYPLFYDCFNPCNGGGPETNSLFAGNPHGRSISHFDITLTDSGIEAKLRYPDTSTENLAASILALVVSAQPTNERPLTVTLETISTDAPPWLERFKTCPDWKTEAAPEGSTKENHVSLTCDFVWDPQRAAIAKGAVPLVTIVRPTNGGMYLETASPPASAEAPAEPTSPATELPETPASGTEKAAQ